jgi:segregation and condensation protein A
MASLAELDEYRVTLDVFEGPLDLLLHLIRQQELDIYDIPIARITDQFLRYVQTMEELNISVAGEFVVMASTLIYIKSRMLLPPDPGAGPEDCEDPRQELVNQLLEHERFKKAADMLHDRQVLEDSVWPRGENEFEEEEQEAVSATVFDLVRSFHEIVNRYQDQIILHVENEGVTIEQKLAELRQLFSVKKEVFFSAFIREPISRSHLIVTFVALLELARLSEVRLFQEPADIRIVAC